MKFIYQLLNPIEWVKAYKFHKKNSKLDKSKFDLELYLYSKILKNDMLHYGHFNDTEIAPDQISLSLLEEAQNIYAENIIAQISNTDDSILDVGCGMGGLANLMLDRGLKVEVLTPNANQIEYIKHKHPSLTHYHSKFEDMKSTSKYGTIINSESLQYINIQDAISKVNQHILPSGKWIIVDYFRLKDTGINKSGHLLEAFKKKIEAANWTITYERDITKNVLPTLKFIDLYVERLITPLIHYGSEKLRFKKGWLYYMTMKQRDKITKKIEKERASVDVSKFVDEKKYMFFVLEKN